MLSRSPKPVIVVLSKSYRTGVFNEDAEPHHMASPANVVLGTFMLWWGWLGFNCGSTFGVSGGKLLSLYFVILRIQIYFKYNPA